MGSGRFDVDAYTSARNFRRSTGTPDFTYHHATSTKPRDTWKAADLLDPLQIKNIRESRDSAEHPESLPVMVFFDVTGSMGTIPRVFQDKLVKLMTLLTTTGGLTDPQLLFGGVVVVPGDVLVFDAVTVVF